MYRRLKQTPQTSRKYTELKQNLNVLNSILNKVKKEAKQKYYFEKFDRYRFDIKNTWKTINEIISKSQIKKYVPSRVVYNNKIAVDNIEIANLFNEYFVGIGPKLAEEIKPVPDKNFKQYLTQRITYSLKFHLITEDELLKTLKGLRTKSSYGYDNISTKLLKQIHKPLMGPLCLIINQSLTTGIFPDRLKIARVFPAHKKGDITIPDNYRPISLLTSISKLFEKVVFIQLYGYFQKYKLFFESQYGFREGHSTEYASLELIDRVINDIENKNISIAIFLDLSKAFDTLDHKILLYKLNYYGITNTELQWFSSYLTNRSQYVEFNNAKSNMLNITTGVPQGSILGPLLFLIYVNDINHTTSYFKFIMYADDTTLITTLQNNNAGIQANQDDIHNNLDAVTEWLTLNKLSLNVAKTRFMLFHARGKNVNQLVPDIKIANQTVARTENFDFLGLTINENLSWTPHVNKISNKISRATGLIRVLKRYLPDYILRIIYYSLVQSHLCFSILAWGSEQSRIFKIQKKVIRAISGSKYNAHTDPIFKTLSILKISDLYYQSCLLFYFRHCQNLLPNYLQNFQIPRHSDLHNYPTRNRSQMLPAQTRTHMALKCIRHAMVKFVNSSPNCILDKVQTHSHQGFKLYIKKYLLSNYKVTCDLQNCYVCGTV